MNAAPDHWRIERLTNRTDFDAVAALESAAFNRPVPPAGFEIVLERPEVFRIYVLRLPECPVAAFCACALVVDELHISTIAVAFDYRRRGLATRLMRHVLAEAAAEGARRATLEVRVSNTAGRRLYERLGFSVAALRKGYYAAPEEDGLILWRGSITIP